MKTVETGLGGESGEDDAVTRTPCLGQMTLSCTDGFVAKLAP
jgi:hypothetical protein